MHGTRNSKILPLMRFKGFYYTPLLKIKGGGVHWNRLSVLFLCLFNSIEHTYVMEK